MAYDNDRVLAQVKLLATVSEGRYTDQELLDLAYDQLIAEVCPLLITVREEYLVRTVEEAIVANTARHSVYARALGNTLRDVKMVNGTTVTELWRVDEEEAVETTGTPSGFYLEGNYIVLTPVPATTTGNLRQSYYARPGKLVPVAEAARITAINTATMTVTCAFPSTWTTTNTFDFVKAKGGFEHLGLDYAASSVASGAITFTTSLPSNLAVGDYVALAGESPVPQIPQELHPLLVQMTVSRVLESMENPAQAASEARCEKLKAAAVALLSNRVQGAPKKFKSSLV